MHWGVFSSPIIFSRIFTELITPHPSSIHIRLLPNYFNFWYRTALQRGDSPWKWRVKCVASLSLADAAGISVAFHHWYPWKLFILPIYWEKHWYLSVLWLKCRWRHLFVRGWKKNPVQAKTRHLPIDDFPRNRPISVAFTHMEIQMTYSPGPNMGGNGEIESSQYFLAGFTCKLK